LVCASNEARRQVTAGARGSLSFGRRSRITLAPPTDGWIVACADWLGEPRIASLVATRTGLDESATARMKPLFVERLRFVSIEDAAVALGVSPRRLQRQLKAEGTTFQRELDCARVEAAMRAMRETNGWVR
jgi:AraC-like DNA-binding protein